MFRTPINVELKPGTIFYVLDKLEVLRETDLIRDTVYESDYGIEAEGRMNWQLVKNVLPAWVGSTIEDYEKFNSNFPSHFEIIRIIS